MVIEPRSRARVRDRDDAVRAAAARARPGARDEVPGRRVPAVRGLRRGRADRSVDRDRRRVRGGARAGDRRGRGVPARAAAGARRERGADRGDGAGDARRPVADAGRGPGAAVRAVGADAAAAVPALRRRRAQVGAPALPAARGGRADRRRRGRRLGGVRARARLLRPGALHQGLQGARRVLARRVRRDLRERRGGRDDADRSSPTPASSAPGSRQHHADERELLVGFYKQRRPVARA